MSISASYPNLRPTLLLDFANSGRLDPRVTFTRASTATYFNSAGVLQSAAIDVPRFDYDPATLAARGFLIEEQRTNLLTYSEQFDNASGWTSSRASVSANATTAPTGTSVADKIVEDATASDTHLTFSANVTVANATVYTYSVYAKAAGRTWFNMQIETGSGAYGATVPFCYFNLSGAGSVGQSSSATGSITPVGNGWYRCVLVAVATTSASITNMRIKLATGDGVDTYTGDGTSGIFVFGAQIEAGAFPTSYIPTTTTALTRSADVASVNTLSPWFNATEGTFVLRGTYSYIAAGTPGFVRLDNNSNNERYMLTISSGTQRFTVITGGSEVADISRPGVVAGTPFTQAGAYKVDDFAACINGGTVATDGAGTLPTVTRLIFRRDSASNYPNGHIQRFTYYPRRLSNAELVSITA